MVVVFAKIKKKSAKNVLFIETLLIIKDVESKESFSEQSWKILEAWTD